jgi:hypothetical protein
MKVKDLKPSVYNPRKISEKKLDMMGKSMKEFGDLSGIVFNRRTGNLMGGHQRKKHFDPSWPVEKQDFTDEVGTVARGWVKTPFGDWVYREVDWDEKKEKAANVAANRHSGEWDYPLLKDLISEIDDGSFQIELVGFEESELNSIFDYETLKLPSPEFDEKEGQILIKCFVPKGQISPFREDLKNLILKSYPEVVLL